MQKIYIFFFTIIINNIEVIEAMEERKTYSGEAIIKQGDSGINFNLKIISYLYIYIYIYITIYNIYYNQNYIC